MLKSGKGAISAPAHGRFRSLEPSRIGVREIVWPFEPAEGLEMSLHFRGRLFAAIRIQACYETPCKGVNGRRARGGDR